jgi:WLM domain
MMPRQLQDRSDEYTGDDYFLSLVSPYKVIGALVAIWVIGRIRSLQRNPTTTKCGRSRSEKISEQDAEVRWRAREASIARQEQWKTKMKGQHNKARVKNATSTIWKRLPLTSSAFAVKSSCNTSAGSSNTNESYAVMPVYDDGVTVFRHIPHLPDAPRVAEMMRRLAKSYIPVIRQRGYDIRSVSEFCCCRCDGLDYQLGGDRFCMLPNETTVLGGHGVHDLDGYNRVEVSRLSGGGQNRWNSTSSTRNTHSIHLRIRQHFDHATLRLYDAIVATMAHELAHCEYHDHGAQFTALMYEIHDQHDEICVLESILNDSGTARDENSSSAAI